MKKLGTAFVLCTSMMIATGAAQAQPDGDFTGVWVTASGRNFATCTANFQKGTLKTYDCGRGARPINAKKNGNRYSWSGSAGTPDAGTVVLIWNGSGLDGEYFRDDKAPGPKGTFRKY